MGATRRVAVAAMAVAALAAATGAVAAAVGASAGPCPPAVRGLGRVAAVTRGRIEVIDLATCRTRTVAQVSVTSPVGRANAPVVQFLGHGRWLLYATRAADGSLRGPFVVPVTGGRARVPVGSGLVAFTATSDGSRVYGITPGGDLISAAPTGGRRVVVTGLPTTAPRSSVSLAISPDGRDATVDISRCGAVTAADLLTVDLRTGRVRTVLRRAGEFATLAGWSPDRRWLLYWPQSVCSASLAADGFPLYAVDVGAPRHPARAMAQTLLYPDFVTWCGGRVVAASTPGRETGFGGKLVQSGPPRWRQRTIDSARPLSWVSPSCSASGRWLVASAGPERAAPFGAEHRSVYLLRPDGTLVRRLSQPAAADQSDEAPRFSRDGRWVLFVRSQVVTRGNSASSRDTIELTRTSGAGAPIALFSFASGDVSYYDHFAWPTEIAWSQAS